MIGTLCILFGAQNILSSIMILGVSGSFPWAIFDPSGEPVKTPEWLQFMNYSGMAVSLIYLVAGIFFLLKKSFSIRLMYSALWISIVARLGILVFFAIKSSSGFTWQMLNVFFLISPAIDLFFLFGVYRISRFYYTKPDQEIYLLGEGTFSQSALKRLSVSGLMVLLIPLSLFLLWEYVAFKDLGYPESSEEYRRYLPSFLQARFAVNYLGGGCSILAFIFSSMGLRLQEKGWRRLNTTVLILGILFLAINLWSMM